MDAPSLTLERFTSLLAQIAHAGRQREVLARHDLGGGHWRHQRDLWLRRLASASSPTPEGHLFSRLYAQIILELEEQGTTQSDPTSDAPTSDEPATLPCGPSSDLEETLFAGPSHIKSPESRNVDAAAFVRKPLLDTQCDDPLLPQTVFGAPASLVRLDEE